MTDSSSSSPSEQPLAQTSTGAKLHNWLQVATMFTVIIGIFLVVYELRQSKQLATADLASQGWQIAMDDNRMFFGENAAEVWGKACLNPSEVTQAEAVVLDRILNNIYSMSARIKAIGRFGQMETTWRDVAEANFTWILSLRFGKWHIEDRLERFDRETAEIAREVLKQSPPPPCAEHLSEFMTELTKSGT